MIKYKKISEASTNWSLYDSTAQEIWSVFTDGVPRSKQLIEHMMEHAPLDDLLAEAVSHIDEYLNPNNLGIEDLRVADAYLQMIKYIVGSPCRDNNKRTKLVAPEIVFTRLDKIHEYAKAVRGVVDADSVYLRTAIHILSEISSILTSLKLCDLDEYHKVIPTMNELLVSKHSYSSGQVFDTFAERFSSRNYIQKNAYKFYVTELGMSETDFHLRWRKHGFTVPSTYGWNAFRAYSNSDDPDNERTKPEYYLQRGEKVYWDRNGLTSSNTHRRMRLFDGK